MNLPVYIRRFNEKQYYESTTASHPVSPYFPSPMKEALLKALRSKTGMRETDYILCPLYKAGDFQLGVTGSLHRGEEFRRAMARELGEEVGIVPKDENDLLQHVNVKRKGRRSIIYECYIKDMVPVLDHQDQAIITQGKDNRSKKVGCWVYGDKKALLDFLDKPEIYVYHSPDDIVGLAAFMVKFIKTFV